MSGESFPENVTRLQALGIKHDHRTADHLVIVSCPICHLGMLSLHETRPWHYCPAPVCESWLWSFQDVLTALVKETGKP
jgi:hypothetical protein